MEKRSWGLCLGNLGSLSLEAIFSIGAGLLAASLFGNLAGYVGARGAVEQGAIAAMRCLTPTDAACQSVAENLQEISGVWRGRSQTTVSSDIYAPRANYTLTYTAREANVSLTPYLVELVQPEAAWREVTVPVVRARAALNIGENRYGRLDFSGTRNWYQLASTFPPASRDESTDPDSWSATNGGASSWERTYGLIDPSAGDTEANRSYTHGPLSISGGQTQQFVSNWISVPKLEDDFPCLDNNPANCSASLAAGGGAGGSNSWRDQVYVAVKASAKVYATAGNPQVSWRQTPAGSAQTSDAGLYIVIEDEAGRQTWRRLGCRDWESVGRGEQNSGWYNLWMRGTAGADGGTAVNPLCGNNDYDEIVVPRGGRFQFIGSLTAQGGTVVAEVVYLYHLADVEHRFEVAQGSCSDVRYSFKNKAPICPSLGSCQVAQGFVPASNWCSNSNLKEQKNVPLCSEAQLDQHSRRFSGAATIFSEQEATCSGVASQQLSVPEGRTVCGQISTEKLATAVEVVGKDESCPAATSERIRKVGCEKYLVKGAGYSTEQCVGSGANFLAAKSGRDLWYTGVIRGEKKLIRPEASYEGANVAAKKLKRVSVSSSEVAVKNERGEVNWPSSKTACELSQQLASEALKQIEGGEFVASCEELNKVASVSYSEITDKNATGYPFDEEVDQLYYGQYGSFDFNPGGACSFNTACPWYEGEKDLGEKLLALARQNDPLLSELSITDIPDYKITETPTGTRRAVSPNEYQQLSEQCAPLLCIESGRFSGEWEVVSNSLVYPEACSDGSYLECYFEADQVVEGAMAEFELADTTLLRAVALQEMGRVRVDARGAESCGGVTKPGCVDLEVEVDQVTGMAELRLAYQLPIGFPLNLLLGADSLPINSTLREPVELLMLSQRN